MELLEHYSNIHNYINENYCHLKYNVEYYTEDFGESVAKTWTAIKHFIIKVWNMIVNWVKGLFSPIIKNWAKLFNTAQSNWSKLKKKIQNEEFTDYNVLKKGIGFKEVEVIDNKVKGRSLLAAEILGSLKIEDPIIWKDIKPNFQSLKNYVFNIREFSDHFNHGKYTLAERIDGFLSKNSYYIDLIKDSMKLSYAFKGFINILADKSITPELLDKLNQSSNVRAITTSYADAIKHGDKPSAAELEFHGILCFKAKKSIVFIYNEKDDIFKIFFGDRDNKKKDLHKNVHQSIEDTKDMIDTSIFLIYGVLDELLDSKEGRKLRNTHIDDIIDKIKEKSLEEMQFSKLEKLDDIESDELCEKLKTTTIQAFINTMHRLLLKVNQRTKLFVDDLLNFFKFLKENA